MTERSPRVVRLPLLAAAVTLLKRLLLRHRAPGREGGRDRSLHPTIGPFPDESGQPVDDDTTIVVTGEAVFVVPPARESVSGNLAPEAVPDPHQRPITDVEIREKIRALVDHDVTLTPLAPDMVSDADIQDACRTVAGWYCLEVKRETALFYAAVTAIRIAERRLGIGI